MHKYLIVYVTKFSQFMALSRGKVDTVSYCFI